MKEGIEMARSAKQIEANQKQITKLIRQISTRYHIWAVFSDWVEIMAITMSNSCDKVHFEKREKRYLEIVKRYNKDELNRFAEAFACLIETLEKTGLRDVLGETFHELELHNKYKGQFFSPFNICEAVGDLTIGSEPKVNKKGYLTLCEPCSGSGAMVLGAARAIEKAKMNYQKQMVVLANDIDILCVHMCYVQLSLFGIPAVVQHGNGLTLEEWSRWYTPLYILDNWIWREKMTFTTGKNLEDEKIKCWLQPMYQLLAYGFTGKEIKVNKQKFNIEIQKRGGFLFEFEKEGAINE